MIYRLSALQENELLSKPETGMGYQIVEARKAGAYSTENFLVLNSEVVIELNGHEGQYIRSVINEGIKDIKNRLTPVSLSSLNVLNEKQYRLRLLNESGTTKGAIDNPVEKANGIEQFVRLSAFDDDKRIDKANKCLLPGSYTTTLDDYALCKKNNYDPVARYALPNNEKIKWAFYIQPVNTDTLQRGIVQPANDQAGGGKEVYFSHGTSKGTFLKQTPY